MGKVTILPETTKDPISLIGRRAGYCWGADVTDENKNRKRGWECIENNHGRAIEFPDVHMLIEGYSARVIREYYTHIGCLPTRLQASTRYIDYKDFDYVVPLSVVVAPDAEKIYRDTMRTISENSRKLESLGVPREDVALLLPLGMTTTIVDKRNLRNLIDMSRHRMCFRANWEFRALFNDILNALSEYSDEWKLINITQMKPTCEYLGYCPEKHSCGRKQKNNEKS